MGIGLNCPLLLGLRVMGKIVMGLVIVALLVLNEIAKAKGFAGKAKHRKNKRH